MSSVDDRIVNMQFNNKQFVAGAESSKRSLNDLESALQKFGTSGSLANIDKNMEQVNKKFSMLGVIGGTAVAKLTSGALDLGKKMAGSLLSPLIAGGKQRALALEQAKFQFQGLGLDIEKTMKSSLDAVNGTAYGLQDAAQLAAQFGGSGMKAGKQMTGALRSVAGMAAQTGRSYAEIGMVMGGIAGIGRVTSQDLLQFGTRGLNVAAKMAEQMGKSEAEVRAMVSQGKISFQEFAAAMDKAFGENATKANETYEGSLANLRAAMSRIGASFATPKFEALRRIFNALTPAVNALHKALDPMIKSYTHFVMSGAKGIEKLFAPFQDPKPLKELSKMERRYQKLQIMMTGKRSDAAVNPFMKLAGTFKEISAALYNIRRIGAITFKAMGDAFSDVFGGSDPTQEFEAIAHVIRVVFRAIRRGLKETDALRTFFTVIFTVLHLGISIIKAVTAGFAAFFGEIFKGASGANLGFLSFIKTFGELVLKFDKFLTSGDKLTKFFSNIGRVAGGGVRKAIDLVGGIIEGIVNAFSGGGLSQIRSAVDGFARQILSWIQENLSLSNLGDLASQGYTIAVDIIQGIISGFSGEGLGALKSAVTNLATSIVEWIKAKLGIASPAKELIPVGIDIILGIIEGIGKGFSLLVVGIQKFFSGFGKLFNHLFGDFDAIDWAAFFNLAAAGGVLLALRKFVKTATDIKKSFSDVMGSISGFFGRGAAAFDQLTNVLKNMGRQVKANIIKTIAIAVGILAVSLIALSYVDPKKLAYGLSALAAVMSMLTMVFMTFTKLKIGDQTPSFIMTAGAMVLLASAIFIIAAAVKKFSSLDPKEFNQGMVGMALSMALMVATIHALSKLGPMADGAAAAIWIMAKAILLMAAAVLVFGKMNAKTINQGMVSMALSMLIMVAAISAVSKLGPQGTVAAGVIMALAKTMVILGAAVLLMGRAKPGTLVKGFFALAGVMAVMVGALLLLSNFSGQASIAAGAIIGVATAILIFAAAVKVIGEMDTGDVIKAGVAIALFVGGIIALAALMTAFPPLAAGLALLAASILAIGLGIGLAGAGALAFAVALGILATVGVAAIGVMTLAIQAFIALLPSIAVQMAASLVAFLDTLAGSAERVASALGRIFAAIVNEITKQIPTVGKLFRALVRELIRSLESQTNEIINAGIRIIMNLMRGIESNIDEFVDLAASIVKKFLKGIGDNADPIAQAAVDMVWDIIDAIISAIEESSERFNQAAEAFGHAMGTAFANVLSSPGKFIGGAIDGFADKVGGMAKKAFEKATNPKNWFRTAGPDAKKISLADQVKQAVRIARPLVKIAQGIADALILGEFASQTGSIPYKTQKTARATSIRADNLESRADAFQQASELAKGKKKQKSLQKKADRIQRDADRARARSDAAAQRAQEELDFARADSATKSEIRSAQAVEATDKSQKLLAQAEAKQQAALKVTGRARKKLLREARADAAEAAKLAKQAAIDSAAAATFFKAAVGETIKAFKERVAQDEWEREYKDASTERKLEMLSERKSKNKKLMDEEEKNWQSLLSRAEAAQKAGNAALADSLIKQAEASYDRYKEAADQFDQDTEAEKQLRGQSLGSSGGAGGPATPSRSVLEDAANIIDRYSASLQEAERLATESERSIQYVQNNYSPEALSASEIYRQTHNLVSNVNIKIGPN